MTKQARLQLISFLDYNADGKRSEKEPLLPDIDLNIDYKPEGKTDKQGELMVSNLTLGKHRVAVNSNTLPLTLKVPDDMYINIKKPVLYKALVPIQATGSTASGKLSIKSVLPKDANSTTFPYIRLLLINKDKQVVQVTETMEDGYFYFGNLPPGEYYLDFEDKFKKSENFKIVKMPEPFKIEYSDDYKQINSVKALAIELLKLQ
jgi:hypothetical protein